MDRLPPELHHQVCGYLPPKDLPNYRLVDKQFAAIGAPVVFRQVTFHSSHASVDRLHAIAADPVLRKHLKYLV